MHELHKTRELAESVAVDAGKRLRDAGRDYRDIRAQNEHDVKLRADTESEAFIRDALKAGSEHALIGEEEGGSAGMLDGDEYYWVVDPLDGTANYQRRIPLSCVSIGLLRGRTPVLGVVYDFHAEALFSGLVAADCRLNGAPLHPSWAQSREEAVLYTGFPHGGDFSEEALRKFLLKVRTYRKIRSLGSAALGLAWVAAGRFDAYYEEAVRLWDVAAGLALVQSAGGVVRLDPAHDSGFLAFNVSAGGRQELLVE